MNEEVLKRLDVLAAKLGVAAGHVWSVLIAQARIAGWQNIIYGITCTALTVICILFMRKCYQNEKADEYDGGGWVLGMLLSGVTGAILVIVSVSEFCDAITCFLNPEYRALEQLLRVLK